MNFTNIHTGLTPRKILFLESNAGKTRAFCYENGLYSEIWFEDPLAHVATMHGLSVFTAEGVNRLSMGECAGPSIAINFADAEQIIPATYGAESDKISAYDVRLNAVKGELMSYVIFASPEGTNCSLKLGLPCHHLLIEFGRDHHNLEISPAPYRSDTKFREELLGKLNS